MATTDRASSSTLAASSFSFPYEDESFDVVFATSVLTHLLPDAVENYLAEIHRVLAPGGRSFVTYFLIDEESKSLMSESEFPFQAIDGGAWVTLPGSKEPGVVLDIYGGGKKARIQVGGLQITTQLRTLKLATAKPPPKKRISGTSTWKLEDTEIKPEVNLIAMRVVEALEKLETYLDWAFSRNLSEVRIVHGKGTGALRRAVVEFVDHSPMVKRHRPGTPAEGEMGVTIVTFK